MATPIPCDWDPCPELADILTSDLVNGGGSGWCGPHYLEVCRAMVRAFDDAQAQAEADATDADALARIEALGSPADPTASAPSSDATGAPGDGSGTPDAAGSDQDTPEPEPAASGRPRRSRGDPVEITSGALDPSGS